MVSQIPYTTSLGIPRYTSLKIEMITLASKIYKWLHIRRLKLGFIRLLNKDLKIISVAVDDILDNWDTNDSDFIIQKYPEYQKALKLAQAQYNKLEAIKFFKNPTTRELSENILLQLYKIEAKARCVAIEHPVQKVESDKVLTNYASKISLKSLRKLHANSHV